MAPAEGFLGKYTIKGERASTDDHPPVFQHLPLSENAKKAAIPIGTVMKRVDGADGAGGSASVAAWEPMLSTDDATPVAVTDADCDPLGVGGTTADTSVLCLVHGGVKLRMLKTGDGKELTDVQVAKLAEQGIYAI